MSSSASLLFTCSVIFGSGIGSTFPNLIVCLILKQSSFGLLITCTLSNKNSIGLKFFSNSCWNSTIFSYYNYNVSFWNYFKNWIITLSVNWAIVKWGLYDPKRVERSLHWGKQDSKADWSFLIDSAD